jgi:hypothetical protein
MSPRPSALEKSIYAGKHFEAEWYFTPEGDMPAYQYYQGMSAEDRARFFLIVQQFCDRRRGDFLPATIYRIEDRDNQIYAFKANAQRFFNFMTSGAKVIVTNAYPKDSQKMSKAGRSQMKVAAKYKADYLQRVSRGTYYG